MIEQLERLKRTAEKIGGIAILIGMLIALSWWLDISSILDKPLGQWTGDELIKMIVFGCITFSFAKGVHEVYGDD